MHVRRCVARAPLPGEGSLVACPKIEASCLHVLSKHEPSTKTISMKLKLLQQTASKILLEDELSTTQIVYAVEEDAIVKSALSR